MLKFIWLEITRKCNLECRHCYAASTPRHPLNGNMSTEHWFAVLREAKDLGCRQVQFIGGEPTLHPDLPVLVREAYILGFSTIEVFTNATTLTPALCEVFRSYNVKVATSFYSASAAVHEQNTRSQGSYDLTVDGITQLIDAHIPLRVEYIDLVPSEEEYVAAHALLTRIGVKQISRNRLQNVGRARGLTSRYSVGDLCGNCGNERLCVSNDGEVHPCIMAASTTLGNVLKGGLRSAIHSPELLQFRSLIEREDGVREHRRRLQRSRGLTGAPSPTNYRNETSGYVANHADRSYEHSKINSCSPDHTGPGPACGPDGGCGPDDHHCGPDHGCGPDHARGPDEQSKVHSCSPDHTGPGPACGPDGGCGPDDHHCGPDHGCGPDHARGPDEQSKVHSCSPDHTGPAPVCGPDGGCGPDDRHCGPDHARGDAFGALAVSS